MGKSIPNHMSQFFQWSDGPNPKVGYDVDKIQFKQDDILYGDYDEMVEATLSGGSYVIPNTLGDGKAIYNESTVGGERVYNLQAMLAQNQDATLSDMTDFANNGRVRNADEPVLDEIPTNMPPVGLMIDQDDQETSIKGIIEENAVNTLLFSKMNMRALQDGIRYGVYQRTKQVIGEQSPNELYIVMRSIMLQYANFQTTSESIVEEIRRLNTKILIYCIENVSSNVLQKVQYLDDIQNLPTPIDRPAYVDKPRNYTYDISNLLGDIKR
jgi:hypothetical protein